MTESDHSYNGWTIYETCGVNLWLGNDEDTYKRCQSLAQSCFEESVADKVLSRKERACYRLASELKDMLEEGNPLAGEASVYADLLDAAISEVNWREIAKGLHEELEAD